MFKHISVYKQLGTVEPGASVAVLGCCAEPLQRVAAQALGDGHAEEASSKRSAGLHRALHRAEGHGDTTAFMARSTRSVVDKKAAYT